MKKSSIAIAFVACALTAAAAAQTRAPTQTTPSRGFQPATPNPVLTKLNALEQELEALKESAGKQVVVLHFSPTEHPGREQNDFSQNQAFATQACQEVLGDRYGRMIDYRVWSSDGRYFLTHISCETKL